MKKWEILNSDPNLDNRVVNYVTKRRAAEKRQTRLIMASVFAFVFVFGAFGFSWYENEILEVTGQNLLTESSWEDWEIALGD
jgi:hypothetical protein